MERFASEFNPKVKVNSSLLVVLLAKMAPIFISQFLIDRCISVIFILQDVSRGSMMWWIENGDNPASEK